MKRLLAMILAALMLLFCASCSSEGGSESADLAGMVKVDDYVDELLQSGDFEDADDSQKLELVENLLDEMGEQSSSKKAPFPTTRRICSIRFAMKAAFAAEYRSSPLMRS